MLGILLLILGIVLGFGVSPWCFFILALPIIGTLEDEFAVTDYIFYNKKQRVLVRKLREIRRKYGL